MGSKLLGTLWRGSAGALSDKSSSVFTIGGKSLIVMQMSNKSVIDKRSVVSQGRKRRRSEEVEEVGEEEEEQETEEEE